VASETSTFALALARDLEVGQVFINTQLENVCVKLS
jgi:hypothetical protein